MTTNDDNKNTDRMIDEMIDDLELDDDEDEELQWIEIVSDEDGYTDDAVLQNVTDSSVTKKDRNKKKRKKKSKLKKVLIVFGGMILTFVLVFVAAFIIMRITGKNSIYGGADSSGPNFFRDETADGSEDEFDINPDDMNDMTVQNGTASNNGTVGNGDDSASNSQDVNIQAGNGADYDIIYNGERYAYNDDMITLLVLGIDNSEPVSPAEDGLSGGQSDSIFLILMNPDTKVMDMIAIPRDTITKLWIYDKDGNFVQTGKAQICLQHGFGDGMELSNERALKAVSYLMYDIPIHSVTSINMGAVGKLNDSVGGVTLKSLETFTRGGYNFVKDEKITLKGDMAYFYLRYRDKSRHNTASERLARQKQYLSLFIKKAMDAVAGDLGVVTDVYNIIGDYVVTDLSLDEMVYLASEAVSYEFGEIYSLQGTLDTSRTYERYYLDEAALQKLIVDKFYEKVD